MIYVIIIYVYIKKRPTTQESLCLSLAHESSVGLGMSFWLAFTAFSAPRKLRACGADRALEPFSSWRFWDWVGPSRMEKKQRWVGELGWTRSCSLSLSLHRHLGHARSRDYSTTLLQGWILYYREPYWQVALFQQVHKLSPTTAHIFCMFLHGFQGLQTSNPEFHSSNWSNPTSPSSPFLSSPWPWATPPVEPFFWVVAGCGIGCRNCLTGRKRTPPFASPRFSSPASESGVSWAPGRPCASWAPGMPCASWVPWPKGLLRAKKNRKINT